jgi:hypothetical protein
MIVSQGSHQADYKALSIEKAVSRWETDTAKQSFIERVRDHFDMLVKF